MQKLSASHSAQHEHGLLSPKELVIALCFGEEAAKRATEPSRRGRWILPSALELLVGTAISDCRGMVGTEARAAAPSTGALSCYKGPGNPRTEAAWLHVPSLPKTVGLAL